MCGKEFKTTPKKNRICCSRQCAINLGLYKQNGKRLKEWFKQKGEVFFKEHQRKAAKNLGLGNIERYKKEGYAHQRLMGKNSHLKNPENCIIAAKKMHSDFKERDPKGYIEHQTKAMLAVQRPSTQEKIMYWLLPEDFIFDEFFICGAPDFRSPERKIILQVDGPTHYKTMGKYYGEDRLRKTQERDARQEEIWRKEGYTVFRLTDYEINEFFKPLLSKDTLQKI